MIQFSISQKLFNMLNNRTGRFQQRPRGMGYIKGKHSPVPQNGSEFPIAVQVAAFFLATGTKHPGIAEKPVFVKNTDER